MSEVIVASPLEFRAERPLPLLRELPTPEPFPTEALGEVLGPAAAAIQDIVQSPWAMCSQAVLAAATLAVQGHADVQLPTGQVKPVSNFFLTVAGSGERKSATDSFALGPIHKHEETLLQTYRAALPAYNNKKLAWDAARKKICNSHKADFTAIGSALDALGPEPPAPLSPLFTCQEPTFEGLCRALQFGQPSVGIFATEGGQFIGGYGMSPENKLRTAAGLSGVWDGETIKRVRASDGVTFLPGRRVSMHLMVQPGVANIMLSDVELADQGMLSRCLVTAPESRSGLRFYREPKRESLLQLTAYESRMHKILQLSLPLAAGTSNVLAPRVLRLSPCAADTWKSFADHVESQIGAGGALDPVIGLANKAPEHAARLAAVLALVIDPTTNEISQEFMAHGITLAQHYLGEALRLFQGSKVDRDIRLAIHLLAWLRSWGEPNISLRDIYQFGPNAIRDRKTALRVVQVLEAHKWLVKLPGSAIVNGERRRDAWHIVREELP